jgi:hypothetical protein
MLLKKEGVIPAKAGIQEINKINGSGFPLSRE